MYIFACNVIIISPYSYMHASLSLLDKLKWNLDINIISILLVDIVKPCLCRGQCSWDFLKRNRKIFSVILKLSNRCPSLFGAMQSLIKYIPVLHVYG